MAALWNDARHALRTLARDRGYTGIALAILAFGIAVNTVIFSLVDGVLLRPLSYREPGRLVLMNEVIRELSAMYPRVPVNAGHYVQWRDHLASFSAIGLVNTATFSLTRAGQPEDLTGARISAGLLPMLGVQPRLGRNFTSEDDQPGHEHVIIISDGLWERRFHRDPSLLGRTLTLDGAPHTVIGILPPSVHFPQGQADLVTMFPKKADVFRPVAFRPERLSEEGGFNYIVIGRLRPGVSLAKASAEVNVLQAAISQHSHEQMHLSAVLTPLQEEITGPVRKSLLVLFGAVGAVLLIVCVNLANLALARATGQGRDLAIRSALGASRAVLLRYALAESLCLAIAGGAAGILLAWAGLHAVLHNAPFDLPRIDEVHLDLRVLLFALGASVLSGLLFGLLPAFRASSADPQQALRSSSRSMTEGRRGLMTRDLLVGFETALSSVLLIAAGLLIGSFTRLLHVDQGFNIERLVTVEVKLPAAYDDEKRRDQYYRQLEAKLQSIPGVSHAGFVSQLPLQGETEVNLVRKEGDRRPTFQLPPLNVRYCSPDYFRAMGVSLVAGAGFTDADRNRRVAVISESAARQVWPGENPVGRKFTEGDPNAPLIEVAGVVRDVRVSIDKPPVLTAYLPYWQTGQMSTNAVLRTSVDPRAIASAVRTAVWSLDADTVLGPMRDMQNVVSESVAQRRFQMQLIAGFALSALVLACLGIYGVVAWSVARRKNEIGIRMALGAGSGTVRGMVMGHALRPVAAGLVAGIVAALALGRILGSLLFGVSAHDPLTIAAVTFVLAATSVLACWIPARRATRTDPLDALRCE